MLSRRANSLLESQIKEKENDIRSMEALRRLHINFFVWFNVKNH